MQTADFPFKLAKYVYNIVDNIKRAIEKELAGREVSHSFHIPGFDYQIITEHNQRVDNSPSNQPADLTDILVELKKPWKVQCTNNKGKKVIITVFDNSVEINGVITTYTGKFLTTAEYNDLVEEIEYQLDPDAHKNKVFYYIRNALKLHPLEWTTQFGIRWYFVQIEQKEVENQYFIFNDEFQYTISHRVGHLQPSDLKLLQRLPDTDWKSIVRKFVTDEYDSTVSSRNEMRLWQTIDRITDMLHKM